MSTDTGNLSDKVASAAEFGMKFAAEKENLWLDEAKAARIAKIVATHALSGAVNSGEVIAKASHDQQVEKLKRRADQFSNSWASVMVQADKQLMRVQSALFEMEDRALAERLAEQIGVILPEPADALFEATK